MRYLRLAADHVEPSLSAPDGTVSLDAPGLSAALVEEVMAWNAAYEPAAYEPVVPAGSEQRAAMRDLIETLDREGRALAAKVAVELAPAKVEYYSEGRSRLLPDAGPAA